MKKIRIAAWVVLAFVFACAGVSLANEGEKLKVAIATGGTGGAYYPIGVGLAKILNTYVPGIKATAETSNASAANIRLISEGKVQFALVQNDVAYTVSTKISQPDTKLRMIASLYPEHVQCITNRGSEIKTLTNLKGRRVSTGAPGSGVAGSLQSIFKVAKISYTDMNADFLDFANTAERLRDGSIDVGFVLAGYPTAAVTSLAKQKRIDLVAFDDALLDALIAEYPYFTKDVIPAGTYRGINYDTPTAAVMAMLVCSIDLDEELVYAITKAIFEHLDELRSVHEKVRQIQLPTALKGASIALHPGAARYYKEKALDFIERHE